MYPIRFRQSWHREANCRISFHVDGIIIIVNLSRPFSITYTGNSSTLWVSIYLFDCHGWRLTQTWKQGRSWSCHGSRKPRPPKASQKTTTKLKQLLFHSASQICLQRFETWYTVHGTIWRETNPSLSNMIHQFGNLRHYICPARTIFHLTATVLALNVRTMYWSNFTSHISRLNLNAIYISKSNFPLSSKILSPSLIIRFVVPLALAGPNPPQCWESLLSNWPNQEYPNPLRMSGICFYFSFS